MYKGLLFGLFTLLAATPALSGSRSGSINAVSPAANTTNWNRSSDPYTLYGMCLPSGSALRSKMGLVYEAAETATDVIAVTVLQCTPFAGGGGTTKIRCPSGSPYAYCLQNDNDGAGNFIQLGVLKLNGNTDPNGLYTGCPSGAHLQDKITLVTDAGLDARQVKGIVTLSCGAATAEAATAARLAICPVGADPYDYCLATSNDGLGNAVKVGVVMAKDAADPYALYGQCNTNLSQYGIAPGFLPKSSLVTAVGQSLDDVRSIDLLDCNAPSGFGGGFPSQLETRACIDASVPAGLAGHYDYCVIGTDSKGNGLIAGVSKQ